MTLSEYRVLALRTDNPINVVATGNESRLLHGAIGIATESGELLDQIKRCLFYGKELDNVNVLEECGDLLWYISLTLDACGFTLEDAMERNIEKLAERYPDGFSEYHALNRNLPAERRTLERDLPRAGSDQISYDPAPAPNLPCTSDCTGRCSRCWP